MNNPLSRFGRNKNTGSANRGLEGLSKLGSKNEGSRSKTANAVAATGKTKGGRRWPRRAFVVINVVLVTVLVSGLAVFGYTYWRFGQIDTLSIPGLPDSGSGDPMNVLLIGSDSREETEATEARQFGTTEDVGPEHSDTIMVLRIDPKEQRAAILSLPRDLWVDIHTSDGTNLGKQKINSAIQGGPGQLVETIAQNFDIQINHFIQVDFNGFRDIVSSVGGVPVRFDSPARDRMSGLDVDNAGCITLSGDQALAYVRSRNYETYESGRWRTDPRADLSRIDRQQDFIRRVLRTAINKGARNPITLNRLVGAGVENVTLDEDFSLSDITRVARRFQSLDPGEVEMMTLPNTVGTARTGGQSVSILDIKQPDANQTIDRFLNGPPDARDAPAVPPSSISVRVLNGSGVSGQASQAAAGLKDTGFVVSGTGDGQRFGSGATTIRYAKGQRDKAETVARFVRGQTTLSEDSRLQGVDVVLTTGSTFAGIADPGAAPEAPAPTEAPGATPEPSAAPNEEC